MKLNKNSLLDSLDAIINSGVTRKSMSNFGYTSFSLYNNLYYLYSNNGMCRFSSNVIVEDENDIFDFSIENSFILFLRNFIQKQEKEIVSIKTKDSDVVFSCGKKKIKTKLIGNDIDEDVSLKYKTRTITLKNSELVDYFKIISTFSSFVLNNSSAFDIECGIGRLVGADTTAVFLKAFLLDYMDIEETGIAYNDLKTIYNMVRKEEHDVSLGFYEKKMFASVNGHNIEFSTLEKTRNIGLLLSAQDKIKKKNVKITNKEEICKDIQEVVEVFNNNDEETMSLFIDKHGNCSIESETLGFSYRKPEDYLYKINSTIYRFGVFFDLFNNANIDFIKVEIRDNGLISSITIEKDMLFFLMLCRRAS